MLELSIWVYYMSQHLHHYILHFIELSMWKSTHEHRPRVCLCECASAWPCPMMAAIRQARGSRDESALSPGKHACSMGCESPAATVRRQNVK